jgi:LacI family transcriptional regulator
VSRTLAKPTAVAPGTREKVLAAARELGYQTGPAGRSLITGQPRTIGLVVPDLENPFFASVTKGVQKRAEMAGYSLLIADSDEEPSQEADLVRTMSRHVDGIVLCSPRGAEQVIKELARECPLVLVNRRIGDLPAVTVDNRDGVRQALDHLRALGHRRIAYVGGPKGSWSNDERLDAFESVGAQYDDSELVDLGNFRPYVSGGVAAADLVIASGATAVLAYNDLLALGVLERARQRGVRVPDELSVVGIDYVPVAALTSPSLSSVEIPRVASGRAGVELLMSLVGDRSAMVAESRDLPVQLVVRDSTGAPGQGRNLHHGVG